MMHTKVVVAALFICSFVGWVSSEKNAAGWKSYFDENTEEWHDLPLTWETNATIPDYIDGVYVRNGPAQVSFGSERRKLTNWLGGFAKLHSFKFNKGRVLSSGKMLEPPNYLKSVAQKELSPQMTMNKFRTPDEEWSWSEKLKIMYLGMKQEAYDNNNPAVWRLGPADKESGIYIACTDTPQPIRFDVGTLNTIGMQYPKKYPITLTGSTHYVREPGTDNSINIHMAKGLTGSPYMQVLRWRPEDDYSSPEEIATFTPTKMSYIHAFSITENYAIIFFYPLVTDMTKIWSGNFHIMETMTVLNNTGTDIYVVNIKNGEVTELLNQDAGKFAFHTINAFESDDEISLDLIASNPQGLHFFDLDDIMNPTDDQVKYYQAELTRHTIVPSKKTITSRTFKNEDPEVDRWVNHFDFPTFNEAYRGKHYCYIYGWSQYGYTKMVLIKKNLCEKEQDKIWQIDYHYSSEMSFVADPAGKDEDDGMLVTLVYDGKKQKNYLMIMDAKTFTPVNHAYIPKRIPMSAHGLYFPEAKFNW